MATVVTHIYENGQLGFPERLGVPTINEFGRFVLNQYGTYENFIGAPTSAGTVSGNTRQAQTFTPTVTHYVSGIDLYIKRVGTPNDVTFEIRTTSAGEPTSTVLASVTVDGNTEISTSYAWHYFIFDSVYLLQASTQYAIVIKAQDSGSDSVYWTFDSAGSYGGGTRVWGTESAWNIVSAQDFWFKEYGVVPTNVNEYGEFFSNLITIDSEAPVGILATTESDQSGGGEDEDEEEGTGVYWDSKDVRKSLMEVTVYRFLDGQIPSATADGDEYPIPEVIGIDLSYGFDQITAGATITITSPRDDDGDYVKFRPMDRVVVREGWQEKSDMHVTFFGFVDEISYEKPFLTQTMRCRDILKLAQNNYYIRSNRKYYSKVANNDGEGGQSDANRQVEKIIEDLLVESGIPTELQDLPVSNVTVANLDDTAFIVEYESAMDAIQELCELVGYKVWADPSGVVHVAEVIPVASEKAIMSFQSQKDVYSNGVFSVTRKGNITAITASVSDDLRNYVSVYHPSYRGSIEVAISGYSPYVPSPPTYRRTEIASYTLDTLDMVDTIAERVYTDLNRLRYSCRLETIGEPNLRIGQTVYVLDEDTTGDDGIYYFLYDYSTKHTSSSYTASLLLAGGAGGSAEGSQAIGNMTPHAIITRPATVNRINEDGTWYWYISVDGSNSYDPDGNVLSFLWEVSGFADQTRKTADYRVIGTENSLTVKLTVTDVDNQTNSDEYIIPLTTLGGGNILNRGIFYTSSSKVYATDDSGGAWYTTGDLY
jgi:hypothetical protein